MSDPSQSQIPRGFHAFALLTAVATLGLICIGGLVTSHGVGMSVPDWPNTYGYNMFFFPLSQWVGGIFYEHTHRLAGALVGFLTLSLALWASGCRAVPFLRWGSIALVCCGLGIAVAARALTPDAVLALSVGSVGLLAALLVLRNPPIPRPLRVMAWLALVAVVIQGVLGGLRVVLIQDELGILHAALAQAFLCLMCALAILTSPRWIRWRAGKRTNPDRHGAPLRYWILACTLAVFVQLLIGATMRHRHAGLAVPDFPLAYGRVWPATDDRAVAAYNQAREETRALNPITGFDVTLHMVHRITAVGILALWIISASLARRRLGSRDPLTRGLRLAALLVLAQIGLGALTVWTNKSADLATAHVAVGSVLLAVGAGFSLIAFARWSQGMSLATSPASVGQNPGAGSLTPPSPTIESAPP